MVVLQIVYNAGHCTFCVVNTGTGVGIEEQAPTPTGTLPRTFQWYHQQSTDFDKAVRLRKKNGKLYFKQSEEWHWNRTKCIVSPGTCLGR